MKFIFDFDDTLFNNTTQFKEHMFICIEETGIARDVAEEYYRKVRWNQFSLKNLLIHFHIENIYEKIMSECKNFVNKDLMDIVKKLGKENCCVVSNGEKEFQLDKINRSQIADFFQVIYTVPGSKKEVIEKICLENKNDLVVFVEDKPKFFEDLDMNVCQNLKTILYDAQGLNKVLDYLK